MSTDFNGLYPSQETISCHRIMDACMRGLEEHDLKGLKIKHIIEYSRLSKQTIYNHYKNRNEVLLATFNREGERLCTACAEDIRDYENLEDKFVAGLLFVHRQLPLNPVLKQIILHHHEFLEVIGLDAAPLEAFGRMCFAEVLETHPVLAPDFTGMAEYWSRSVLSLLLFRGGTTEGPEDLERYVRQRLVPGLGLPV